MPVSAEHSSSSSTTIAQHIGLQRPRNQTTRKLRPFVTDDPPLIHVVPPVTRLCKSAMSSFFLVPTFSSSSSSNETSVSTRKKLNGFPQSSSFRRLGCTASASQRVSVPELIRSSADWDASHVKNKKKTKKNKKNKGSYNGGSIKILSEASTVNGGGCGAVPDVWCGPGIGFSTDAVISGSIEPVESDLTRRNIPARRKIDGDKNNTSNISHNPNPNPNQREGSSVLTRRSINQDLDLYHRHSQQHPYNDGLAEMMMLQNGFMMGGILNSHDHFHDLRLDVDNMSYEELLELGDRIGYVNTGLKEKQIKICVKIIKPFISETPLPIKTALPLADRKCSICQDEYEAEEEVGQLPCGHMFHVECVKQWLFRKNTCPFCKTTAYVKKALEKKSISSIDN